MAQRIKSSAEILKSERRKAHINAYYRQKAKEALLELQQQCERLTNAFLDYQAAMERVRDTEDEPPTCD